MIKDILKIAYFSFMGIFIKRFNQKARDIIKNWKPEELKKNLISLTLFYIFFVSLFLYILIN
jgi:hypothetical protein